MLFKMFRRGTRWTGSRMEWSKEWEVEDDLTNEHDDKRCMLQLRKLSNSISSDIQMEEDYPSRD